MRALTVPLAALLAVVAVSFGAQSAFAAAPSLRFVPWASGSFLFSDGSHSAVLGTGPADLNGVVVVDTTTGRRIPASATACTGGGYSSPAAVGAGVLLEYCYERDFVNGAQFILTSLTSGETTRVEAPRITAEHWVPWAIGKTWIEIRTAAYHGNSTDVLFNLATRQLIEESPSSYTTYLDLDASNPVRPLCRPVRIPKPYIPPGANSVELYPASVATEHGWVVMSNLYAHPEEILAWHCGQRQPRVVTTRLLHTPQFGSGIVTWIAHGSILYAEQLATGRRWHWTTPYGFAAASHTANRIYAVENCPAACQARKQGNRVVTASLRGL